MTDRKKIDNNHPDTYLRLQAGALSTDDFSCPNWILNPDSKNDTYILPSAEKLSKAYPRAFGDPDINVMPRWKIYCLNIGTVPALIEGEQGKVSIPPNRTPAACQLLWVRNESAYCLVSAALDADLALSMRVAALEGVVLLLKAQLISQKRKTVKQITPPASDDEPEILDFEMTEKF